MKDKEAKQNNVLSFNQPPDFYIKKAEKHIDAGNFIEALQLYRQVLGMDPKNVEYLLCIAQIYTEMGLYPESNDVLLKIARYGETPTECLFAMGCNYMGIKNYALADEMFEQYLALEPDGEFTDEIDDIFDMIDSESMSEAGILHDVNQRLLVDAAYAGKVCFDKGDFKGAIDNLEKVYSKDKTMYAAINNLALAYFFDGNKERAVEISQEILGKCPDNLHACCNLAFFYSDRKDFERASECLDKLDRFKDIDPDDMHKVALTYCELGYHRKAYKCFAKIVQFQPYDMRLLHFCGLAAYNSGRFSEAINCFVRVLKIDPGNSLAKFYLDQSEKAKKDGAVKSFEYVYQVQFGEIKRRIKYLNECLKQKDSSLKYKWKNDAYFKSIIMWGLYYGDDYIKKIVIEIMCMFSDEHVEEEFRNFLLKTSEKDEIKNDIFMYLKRMGAKEPYIAYVKGSIAEVRVGNVTEDISKMAKPYADALGFFVKNTRKLYSSEIMTAGVELIATIAKLRGDDGKWIKHPQAFAAALELCICHISDIAKAPTFKQLSQRYDITRSTFNRYYQTIAEYLEEGDDYAD